MSTISANVVCAIVSDLDKLVVVGRLVASGHSHFQRVFEHCSSSLCFQHCVFTCFSISANEKTVKKNISKRLSTRLHFIEKCRPSDRDSANTSACDAAETSAKLKASGGCHSFGAALRRSSVLQHFCLNCCALKMAFPWCFFP